MKNRLLHNIYVVVLVALGLGAQEVSASSYWSGTNLPNWMKSSDYGAKRGFGSVARSSVSPISSSMGGMVSSPAVSAAEGAIALNAARAAANAPVAPVTSWYDRFATPSYRLSPSVPSMATIRETPGNIWRGIKSYQLPTKEEAMQAARAFPGQAYGGAEAVLGYVGRPAMAAPSAVGSGASWLGGKLGSAWSSYAPQAAKDYASRAGQYISENAYTPVSNAFNTNVWNPVSGYISSNVVSPASQYLSTTSAANWLAGMTDEQKQAAVGLAAVLAAGLAAKKGYDYWRGPSAYSQFKQVVDESIMPMLIMYINAPNDTLAANILHKIDGYIGLVNREFEESVLSQSEVANLVKNLNLMKVQFRFIDDINKRITALTETYIEALNKALDQGKGYQSQHWDKFFDEISSLYQNVIGQSPILTAQQKTVLQSKIDNTTAFMYVNDNLLNKQNTANNFKKIIESVLKREGYFKNISENQQNALIAILNGAIEDLNKNK